MSSTRRLALLLALAFATASFALAQSSTSESSSAEPAQAPAQADQSVSQGQISVQARIRARRAQRRAAAIHEAYDHRYEFTTGMGYLRFVPGPGVAPGPGLEHAHEYAWDFSLTRFRDERLGYTADLRGYYATAYVGLQPNNLNIIQGITNPAISQYAALAGPTYRFYLQPKYSVSGRLLGGIDHGNFSGDLAGGSPVLYGLWPNGNTFGISASIPVEYNLTPRLGLRVAPEYFFSGFGSTVQYTRGFTTGLTYRFGKQ
ncbi:MAG: hypothetical protein ABSG00_02265 [Terracidiphilus sp.]|jgi:hypothetical protein